jgi:predicted nuclease with RNAse H fold
MDLSQTRFIGIDLGGTRGSFTCAILDENRRIQFRGEVTQDEWLAKLDACPIAIAAITSPINLNEGVMADDIIRSLLTVPPPPKKYTSMRQWEYELLVRGFTTPRMPNAYESCSPALQRALRFASNLAAQGFKRWPAPGAERQLMETHPDAAYAQLLGAKLNPLKTLEGRIQRQLLLQEEHLNVRDPMIFFEEITRHKMLIGQMPEGILISPVELNALIAAYTAWSAYTNPTGVTRLGEANEGCIILPANSRNR